MSDYTKVSRTGFIAWRWMTAFREWMTSKTRYNNKSRQYYSTHREQVAATRRAYRLSNLEAYKSRLAKWRSEHVEQVKSYSKQYQVENKETIAAQRSEFYKNNRERLLKTSLEWANLHPEYGRMNAAKRRALKTNASVGNTSTIIEWEKRWKSNPSVTCYWCGLKYPPTDCVSDHLVPLSKHGPHSIENLVVSCNHCNQRKYNKSVEVWCRQLENPILI